MAKPIKYTVAVVLKQNKDTEPFLVVKRPSDDPDLAGDWGLPAISLRPDELPEAGATRAVFEKLGCEAKPSRFLGVMFQKRNSYDIFLMDIEMVLTDGQPNVHKAQSTQTVYVEQKWTSNPMDLMASARHGSCCSSIFLTKQGLLDRDEWISSLEGSHIVG